MAQREVYELRFKQARPGHYKRALRILPLHPELPHRMDFALVRWGSPSVRVSPYPHHFYTARPRQSSDCRDVSYIYRSIRSSYTLHLYE